MRCAIAKSNPVLMDMATAYYLAQHYQGQVFTFKSLYRDDEPYPLGELLIFLGSRIDVMAEEYKAFPTDMGLLNLGKFKRYLKRLIAISKGQ